MPLSTGLRCKQMNCRPIDAPAAAAMASGRGAGRVPPVPPAALIATTATRARPMPAARGAGQLLALQAHARGDRDRG